MSALMLTAQQTESGTVQGVVRDATSAVAVAAKVTIIHSATMTRYSTSNNDVGFFGFSAVQPGSYEVTIEATGMLTWEGEFLLQVWAEDGTRPNPEGGRREYANRVAGDVAPLVTTSDATFSVNLERARIDQLPQNGRNIANLVLANTPGLAGRQDVI